MTELLFYDIEVFANDWLIVFKSIDKSKRYIFHGHTGGTDLTLEDDPDYYGLDIPLIQDIIKNKTLVAYNNYNYDDKILSAILENQPVKWIKRLNDTIINGKPVYQKLHPDVVNSLDCWRQIGPTKIGLKRIEANRGSMIKESDIPFTIDRPLTREELLQTIFYCEHDVDELILTYEDRVDSYFAPKQKLLDMLPEEKAKAYHRYNTTFITSEIIYHGKKAERWGTYHLTKKPTSGNHETWLNNDMEYIASKDFIPPEVWEMWNQDINHRKTKKIRVNAFGSKIDFSFGGLHGVNDSKQRVFNKIVMLDVRSLYPSIIILLEMFGEEATKRYSDIVSERIRVKHTDQVLQAALKVVINSAYGLTIDKYSKMYNPYLGQSVCMFGQIALYDLCKRLYEQAGCQLVNINTDGVGFVPPVGDDSYIAVHKQWEADYGLVLEETTFDLFVQKDVNNYVARKLDGSLKTKGKISRYGDSGFKNSMFKDSSVRIVDTAIVDYFMNGVDPLDTILNHLHEPILFQRVLSVGRTYIGVCDENKQLLSTKVNRVFAVKEDHPDRCYLYKARENGVTENFPKAPKNMLIWNDAVSDLTNFAEIVDLQYYLDLINETLEQWE